MSVYNVNIVKQNAIISRKVFYFSKTFKMKSKKDKVDSDTVPESRQFYKCPVANCPKTVRGDRISEHFQKKSKHDVLDEAKKLVVPGDITSGLEYINNMLTDDENHRNHTKYLLNNGYSSTHLPKWWHDGFKKKVDYKSAFQSLFQIPATATTTTGATGDAGATAATSATVEEVRLTIF